MFEDEDDSDLVTESTERVTGAWPRISHEYDPERCQSMHRTFQCMYKAIPGAKFCKRHCPAVCNPNSFRSLRRMYRLGKFQARMEEFASSDDAKKLHNELGILRVMFEETLKQCENEHTLLFSAGKILQLTDAITKTLVANTALEAKLNQHLTAQQLFGVAEQILECAVKYIPDPEQCARLAQDLGEILASPASITVSGKNLARISQESRNASVDVEREVPDHGSAISGTVAN